MRLVAIAGAAFALASEERRIGVDPMLRRTARVGTRRRGFHHRRIDQGAALEHQVPALELGIDEPQQLRVGARLMQPLAKPAERGVVGRRFLHLEPDKAPERQPVAQRLFQAAIRQAGTIAPAAGPGTSRSAGTAAGRPPCGTASPADRRSGPSSTSRRVDRRPSPLATLPPPNLQNPAPSSLHTPECLVPPPQHNYTHFATTP